MGCDHVGNLIATGKVSSLGGTINLAFYGGCNALYSLPESTKEDFDVLEV